MTIAQIAAGYSLVHLLIIAIIVIACIAVFVVVTRAMGWSPPPWVAQVFWIVLAAVVGILAIHVIVSAVW